MARTVLTYDSGAVDAGGASVAFTSGVTVTEAALSLSDNTTANVSTSKHGLTPKLPNDATKYLDGTGGYTVPSGSASGIPTDGWVSSAGWSYSSADSPTFVIATSSDLSGTIPVGARIKLTQTTAKYFIVTAIDATTITVYGGTDYTLANAAVTSPCWSPVKAPFGFPTSPAKWTVTTTDTNSCQKASPASGTWYGDTGLSSTGPSISIPIGVWHVRWEALVQTSRAAAGALEVYGSLSTSASSESDATMSTYQFVNSQTSLYTNQGRERQITAAAKTTYYLVTRTTTASQTVIGFRGDVNSTVIRAVCAYL